MCGFEQVISLLSLGFSICKIRRQDQIVLDHGLVNSGPWVQSGPLLVFVNKVLFEQPTLVSLNIIYGCFHATLSRVEWLLQRPYDLQGLNYCLGLYRKCLLTPGLEDSQLNLYGNLYCLGFGFPLLWHWV